MMANLFCYGIKLAKSVALRTPARQLSLTVARTLKEIHVKQERGTVEITGVTVPSPRTELLVRAAPQSAPLDPKKNKCYMCALSLDVKHTDVLILSQFLTSNGLILPRRITGLCTRQQKRIGTLIAMAQKAGLMINITPPNCKKDPRRRRGPKAFNTYFDESTIFAPKPTKWVEKFRRLSLNKNETTRPNY